MLLPVKLNEVTGALLPNAEVVVEGAAAEVADPNPVDPNADVKD